MIPFETNEQLTDPRIRHGFFGRRGGVSNAPYDTLNCGNRSGDDPRNTAQNRERAVAALDRPQAKLLTLSQIHSDQVEIIDSLPEAPLEGDGLVTTRPDIALGILTADCGPVLLSDPENGVIGACHAGWRGALNGILECTIAAMVECGADMPHIRAVIGPCIHQGSYEVGPEFQAEFSEIDSDYDKHFNTGTSGRAHFDLPGFIGRRLGDMGVERINLINHDTYARADQYFSYRRNTHEGISGYGRNLSVICLTPG